MSYTLRIKDSKTNLELTSEINSDFIPRVGEKIVVEDIPSHVHTKRYGVNEVQHYFSYNASAKAENSLRLKRIVVEARSEEVR